MKRKIKVHTYKASHLEYFHALAANPTYYNQLLGAPKKPYSKLLDWFLKNREEFLQKGGARLSIKEISEQTGIDRRNLNQNLKKMYDDIVRLNWERPEIFVRQGQILCFLVFEHRRCSADFKMGLDTLPRVDDCFEFPFVIPQIGQAKYFVKSITHRIANGEQSIWIYLDSDEPNMYLKLLKEKAFLNKRISIHEFYDPHSLSLEEKLLEMYQEL